MKDCEDKQCLESIDNLNGEKARELIKSLYIQFLEERDYYIDGSMCSMAESIHGEQNSNKVLKSIRSRI